MFSHVEIKKSEIPQGLAFAKPGSKKLPGNQQGTTVFLFADQMKHEGKTETATVCLDTKNSKKARLVFANANKTK